MATWAAALENTLEWGKEQTTVWMDSTRPIILVSRYWRVIAMNNINVMFIRYFVCAILQ